MNKRFKVTSIIGVKYTILTKNEREANKISGQFERDIFYKGMSCNEIETCPEVSSLQSYTEEVSLGEYNVYSLIRGTYSCSKQLSNTVYKEKFNEFFEYNINYKYEDIDTIINHNAKILFHDIINNYEEEDY